MENVSVSKKQSEILIICGVLLFLLALLVGLAIPIFTTPRMGLSAHLGGVLNGVFLMILGLIWHKPDISQKWQKVTFYLFLYGTFANFIAGLIGAITGSGKLMPIAGGKEGTAMVEAIITFLLLTLSIAMIIACIVLMKGLYNSYKKNDQLN